MKLFLVCALAVMMVSATERINFGKDADGQDWSVMNDTEVGGKSQGYLGLSPDGLLFEGKVVMVDGEGFASVRSPFSPQELEAFTKVKVQYKSQGQPFVMTFETTEAIDDACYQLLLPNTQNEWKSVELELKELPQFDEGKATGKKLSKGELAKIQRLGFVTAASNTAAFMFEVNYVEFN